MTGDTNPPIERRTFAEAAIPATVAIVSLAGVTLAWILPERKPRFDAFTKDVHIFGRYSYLEFLIAIIITLLAASIVFAVFTQPKRRKRGVFRIIAIWFGLGVAVVAGELVALCMPPLGNPFYLFNAGGTSNDSLKYPELPYVRPPNLHWEGISQGDIPEYLPDPHARKLVLQTDWQGFRNSKDIRNADLVFIGDSFTEGGNVAEEETFVWRTSNRLNVSGRNLGLFGYAPQPEFVVLKEFGLPCNPKVVVWQIFDGNDLSDASRYAHWHRNWVASGKPSRVGEDQFRHTSWTRCSPTYRLFSFFVRRPRFWHEGIYRDDDEGEVNIRFSYMPRASAHLPNGHEAQLGWLSIVESFQSAKELLDERGIKLVVVFIPMKFQVMAPYVEFDEWSRQRPPRDWPFPEDETLAAYLARLCNQLEVAFVDTTTALEQTSAEGEAVFLPFDTHLSPKGHEVVSEQLVPVVGQLLEAADTQRSRVESEPE